MVLNTGNNKGDSENVEDIYPEYSAEYPSAHHLEKIPRNVDVKKKFEDHYRELLGDDYDKFMNYSLSYIRKCIRVNTLKANVEDIKKRLNERWQLEEIPW